MSPLLLPTLTALGSLARTEPLLRWAVVCWEAEPGVWEMGGRQEPEQTLRGGPSTMMVCAKARSSAGAAAEFDAELLEVSWGQEFFSLQWSLMLAYKFGTRLSFPAEGAIS